MKYIIEAYKNYFNITGRANRKEFWIYYAFHLGVILLLFLLFYVNFGDAIFDIDLTNEEDLYLISSNIFLILIFWFVCLNIIPAWTIFVRRIHDVDKSAKRIVISILLLSILPIVPIFFGVFLSEDFIKEYIFVVIGAYFVFMLAILVLNLIILVYIIKITISRGSVGENQYGLPRDL